MALHCTVRCSERAAAGIAETVARADFRPLAHDAVTTHLLNAAQPVGDAPIAAQELHRLGGQVGDLDRIGEEVSPVLRTRFLVEITWLDCDAHTVAHGLVHDRDLVSGDKNLKKGGKPQRSIRQRGGKAMLDGMMRRLIDPVLDRIAGRLVLRGIGADTVTFTGFALGLVSALGVAIEADAAALLALALSRLCDGLDGAVARRTTPTDRGGYMDIVLDFAFYGAIPLAFALRDPQANAMPAVILLFTFYVNGASFLAFSAVAAKRQMGFRRCAG